MPYKTPVVDVSGIEGNAFRLLVRVRNALRDVRAGKSIIALFNAKARSEIILSTPTAKTHPEIWNRALRAAGEVCTIHA